MGYFQDESLGLSPPTAMPQVRLGASLQVRSQTIHGTLLYYVNLPSKM